MQCNTRKLPTSVLSLAAFLLLVTTPRTLALLVCSKVCHCILLSLHFQMQITTVESGELLLSNLKLSVWQRIQYRRSTLSIPGCPKRLLMDNKQILSPNGARRKAAKRISFLLRESFYTTVILIFARYLHCLELECCYLCGREGNRMSWLQAYARLDDGARQLSRPVVVVVELFYEQKVTSPGTSIRVIIRQSVPSNFMTIKSTLG